MHNHHTDDASRRDDLLKGLRILLVEDDALIAIDCQEALIEAGAACVDIAKSNSTVMDLLVSSVFDVAVIDIHLGNESGIPIAASLSERNLPFIFCTGAVEGAGLPEPLQGTAIVNKPYEISELILAIRATIVK